MKNKTNNNAVIGSKTERLSINDKEKLNANYVIKILKELNYNTDLTEDKTLAKKETGEYVLHTWGEIFPNKDDFRIVFYDTDNKLNFLRGVKKEDLKLVNSMMPAEIEDITESDYSNLPTEKSKDGIIYARLSESNSPHSMNVVVGEGESVEKVHFQEIEKFEEGIKYFSSETEQMARHLLKLEKTPDIVQESKTKGKLNFYHIIYQDNITTTDIPVTITVSYLYNKLEKGNKEDGKQYRFSGYARVTEYIDKETVESEIKSLLGSVLDKRIMDELIYKTVEDNGVVVNFEQKNKY